MRHSLTGHQLLFFAAFHTQIDLRAIHYVDIWSCYYLSWLGITFPGSLSSQSQESQKKV